jgi:hypothetical protein
MIWSCYGGKKRDLLKTGTRTKKDLYFEVLPKPISKKNSPSYSVFDALSNGICLMIIYKTININTEVKVHIIQTLSSVETRVIFTRKIAKNQKRGVRS